MIKLIDVEEWTRCMTINVDIFVANRKQCESFINRHQTCIWTQNNIRMSIFFMSEIRKKNSKMYVISQGKLLHNNKLLKKRKIISLT